MVRRSRRLLLIESYGVGMVIPSGPLVVRHSLATLESAAVIGLLLGTVLFVLLRLERTELSAAGIRVVGRRGDHRIPWTSVLSVDEHRQLGARGVQLTLAGRVMKPAVPYTWRGPFRDPDFDAKVRGIHEWWLAFGGRPYVRNHGWAPAAQS